MNEKVNTGNTKSAEKPFISYLQLASILIIGYMFTITTPVPKHGGYNMEHLGESLISWGVLTLLYLPLLIFTIKNKQGAFTVLPMPLKWLFGCILIVRLLFITAITALKLNFFVTKTIIPYLAPSAFIIILFAGILYGMLKGLQATSRVAPIVLLVYVLFIVLITALVFRRIDIDRLYWPFYGDRGQLFKGSFHRIIHADQIYFFVIMSGFIRTKLRKKDYKKVPQAYKALILFIPIALFKELWLDCTANAVFGKTLSYILYPIHAVSAFARFNLIERMDGVFVSITITAGLVKTIASFVCIRIILTELLPNNQKASKITASVLLTVLATGTYFMIGKDQQIMDFFAKIPVQIAFAAIIAATTVILPIIAFIFNKKKGENNNENEKEASLS